MLLVPDSLGLSELEIYSDPRMVSAKRIQPVGAGAALIQVADSVVRSVLTKAVGVATGPVSTARTVGTPKVPSTRIERLQAATAPVRTRMSRPHAKTMRCARPQASAVESEFVEALGAHGCTDARAGSPRRHASHCEAAPSAYCVAPWAQHEVEYLQHHVATRRAGGLSRSAAWAPVAGVVAPFPPFFFV
jgi:hypothetical protein